MFRCGHCGAVSQPREKAIQVVTQFRERQYKSFDRRGQLLGISKGWEVVTEEPWLRKCVELLGGETEIEPELVEGGT